MKTFHSTSCFVFLHCIGTHFFFRLLVAIKYIPIKELVYREILKEDMTFQKMKIEGNIHG